jgi:hypothetical protein
VKHRMVRAVDHRDTDRRLLQRVRCMCSAKAAPDDDDVRVRIGSSAAILFSIVCTPRNRRCVFTLQRAVTYPAQLAQSHPNSTRSSFPPARSSVLAFRGPWQLLAPITAQPGAGFRRW